MTDPESLEILKDKASRYDAIVFEQEDLKKNLDQARERLNLALSAGKLAWWEMDCRTGKVVFNENKTRMLGYTFEEFNNAHYTAFTNLVHPDDRDRAMEAMRKHLYGENELYEVEYRIRKKSGDYIWFYDRGSITERDVSGKPLFVKGIVFDITQRIEAEQALAERVKELNCHYEVSKLVQDPDTSVDRILKGMVNLIPSAWQYTEITYVELNYDNQRFRTPNFQETAWQQRCDLVVFGVKRGFLLVGYLEEKPEAAEGPFLKEERDLLNALGARVGRIIEYKMNEESLREREAMLRLALNAANAGVWEWKLHEKKDTWSDELWNLFGVAQHSVEPSFDAWLQTIYHADREKIRTLANDSTQHGTVFKAEWRVEDADGRMRWLASQGKPLYNDIGQMTSYIGIVIDITERKKLEEELTHRSLELELTNRELETFSFSVSHDLRSPLRSIKGFSDIILEDYANKLDADGQNYLKRISSNVEKMNVLIDDILSLSKVAHQEMRFHEINLSSIALSVIRDLHNADPDRNVEVVIMENIKSRGDDRLMHIALANLIGNAWKYSGKTKYPKIEFGKIIKNGENIYFVRDNGAGFDMKHAQKLFAPFQRLHSESQFQGTGIGLSIVNKVIQRHGGRIWAESELNKGATFYFTLPENK